MGTEFPIGKSLPIHCERFPITHKGAVPIGKSFPMYCGKFFTIHWELEFYWEIVHNTLGKVVCFSQSNGNDFPIGFEVPFYCENFSQYIGNDFPIGTANKKNLKIRKLNQKLQFTLIIMI